MLKAWLSRTLGLETRAATLASPNASLMALFGSLPSIAGASVSPSTAMRCAPVRRCVNVISETIGGLPIAIHEIDASGARKPVAGHSLNRLLTVAANPWTPPGKLIEQAARDALLHGNSFTFVNRVGGEVRELIRLPPEAVQVTYQIETGEPHYRVTNGEDQRDLPREDVLHIAATSIDGVVGLSPVIEAREAIGLCLGTGARAGEALWLDWANVDLDKRQVTFVRTKNGETRSVPLNSRVAQLIAALPHREGAVFRTPAGEPYARPAGDVDTSAGSRIHSGFSAACRRAGIQGFRVHDCRHTWATWFYMANHDLAKLQALGGWKTMAMVFRYAHSNVEEHAASMENLPWGKSGEPTGKKAAKSC